MATSPDNQSFFTPTNDQWRKDSVDLSNYYQQGNIQIAFRNIGDWGNSLYLDNINIGSMANLSPTKPMKRLVYPNPACPGSLIQLSGAQGEWARLIDQNGKEVARWINVAEIKLDGQTKAGTYLLQVYSNELISNHTLIVVE